MDQDSFDFDDDYYDADDDEKEIVISEESSVEEDKGKKEFLYSPSYRYHVLTCRRRL